MALAGTTVSQAPSNSSAALFRLWGGMISAQLLAAGWVKTADTGQIDFTTVGAPTASTMAGYEVWRMADALQATAPVFLKIEYGATSTVNTPSIAFTIGAGSNGSGTLTGTTSVRALVDCSTNSVTAFPSYFCGDTGRIVMALWCGGASSSSQATLLSIERSVDATGAVTGEAVLLTWKGTAWRQVAWICLTGPATVAETSLTVAVPSVGNGASGSSISVYPIYHTKGVFFFPGRNLLGCFEASFTANTAVTFTYYGVSQRFMALTAAVLGGVFPRAAGGAGTGTGILVRYDP